MAGFYNPYMKTPDWGQGFQDMSSRMMMMLLMKQLMGQQQPQQQPQMQRQPMPQYPTGAGGLDLSQNIGSLMSMGATPQSMGMGQMGMPQGQPQVPQMGMTPQGMSQQGQFDPQMLMQFLMMMMRR